MIIQCSDLEFIGEIGGEAGAGASPSSSSSSPHSSSLRGVMLFPNHTEWMDTCSVYESTSVNNMQTQKSKSLLKVSRFWITNLTQFVVHIAHLPLCVYLQKKFLMADEGAWICKCAQAC